MFPLIALIALLQAPPQVVATQSRQIPVPITVTVEGGGALPTTPSDRPMMIQFVPASGGKTLTTLLASTSVSIPYEPDTKEEYRLRIDNVPEDYIVKSITFDSTDLMKEPLKVSLALLPLAPPRIVTYTGEGELQQLVNAAMQKGLVEEQARKRIAITLAKRLQ